MTPEQTISLADLFVLLAGYRWPIAIVLAATPVAVWLLGRGLGRYRGRLFARLMSVPVYGVVLPGVFVLLVIGYMLFFSRQNLLTEVDVVLAGVPVLSMAVTLWVIRQFVAFKEIPGFDELSGMVVLALLAFVCLLLVLKLRIFVGVFGGAHVHRRIVASQLGSSRRGTATATDGRRDSRSHPSRRARVPALPSRCPFAPIASP